MYLLDIVEFEVTTQCNFRCIHCYCNAGEKDKEELNFEEIKNLILQVKELKIKELDLVGGEPFMHPKILDIISFAHNIGQKVIINTNGSLITNDLAKSLKKISPNLIIGVSLEGPDPETNDFVRGKGNFERAVKGIEILINYGFPVTILNIINKRNWMKFEELVIFARNIGVRNIYVDRFISVGRGEIFAQYLDMEDKEWIEAIKYVREVIKKYKKEMNFFVEESISGEVCSAGISHVSILANGYVVPCGHLRFDNKYYLGNIREKSLGEILGFTKLKEIFKEVNSCKNCNLNKLCNGGCKAYQILKNKEKDIPLCVINKEKGNILFESFIS
ncbi:MAG: radical SAM protein [Dictyoglomus sp.]|nr:radical SAM protein [Dictyoglomus sp.]MDW8189222.1 radical SAM protein [Dictyoglomus sp.]